jgi:ATP-dependent exoDNAse (exonuclease V) beta subunit
MALADEAARLTAISAHGRSILVEAGAGSGKTAVMAGRIALLLAQGIAPRQIAAVTFTELAASELLTRVREFVHELLESKVATELRIALPDGLSHKQKETLAAAASAIDEITCSTIHGFCQRLIKPYPAEADIDPGATIIDRAQGDLAFYEIVAAWLRERLSGEQGGLLAELVLQDPKSTVTLLHTIAASMRQRRGLIAPPVTAVAPLWSKFNAVVAAFLEFLRSAGATETESEARAKAFEALTALPDPTTSSGLVALLTADPGSDLLTQQGKFRAFQVKGKWGAVAKSLGLSKAEGERLFNAASSHYQACCDAWTPLQQAAASEVLATLIEEARPVLTRYRNYKRSSAQLDFDDLIYSARDLLRDHDAVRRALGKRFTHVLVDEFQDTDPLQTEIFWRLCGEPPVPGAAWQDYRIRDGALFLVGDPKQAIYRFRGADVAAYVQAREVFRAQDGESLLSISTNFRSRRSILTFVNDRFASTLSAVGQPGFTALDAFHFDPAESVAVVALDIKVADADGKASAEVQRDEEAEQVAELCARLIGQRVVMDRRTGQARPCEPGDIALLAPSGKELWRYEEALERRGIPVATQAGKGFFRRQEIQDLIALTRALADGRDTLALGAFLRGPLVGLTEEELLDLVWGLPRNEGDPERIPRLNLNVDAERIVHPLAKDVLAKLQSLRRCSNGTTPHQLLSQAVDVFRVRPILLERHRGQAERALANVDLYLSFTVGYAVRGLQAFADAMSAAWSDEERAVEGRPDAQEASVALFTMHASKGLEWPIVIPINTMTGVIGAHDAVVDRNTNTFYCSVLGIAPSGHDLVKADEEAELQRERIRLWYVAITRARELLVLPRTDVAPGRSAWNSLLDLALPTLPAIDPATLPPPLVRSVTASPNAQARESFGAEAAGIASRQQKLTWKAPSRNEGVIGTVELVEEPEVWTSTENESTPDLKAPAAVQGGMERGLILHKLMEEILTGETSDAPATVEQRAAELIHEFDKEPVSDGSTGLSVEELSDCVARTLALPQVAALRPALLAEFPIYGSERREAEELVTSGIADALTLTETGAIDVVVDWKSDVSPSEAALAHYREQVGAYLNVTSAREGLIVLMSSGVVIPVIPGDHRSVNA